MAAATADAATAAAAAGSAAVRLQERLPECPLRDARRQAQARGRGDSAAQGGCCSCSTKAARVGLAAAGSGA